MIRNLVAGGSLRWLRLAPVLAMVVLSLLLLAGCGLFSRGEQVPTPEAAAPEDRALVPTFTATPEGQSVPTPQPVVQPVTQMQALTATQPVSVAQVATATQGMAAGLAAAAGVTATGPVTATVSVTAGTALTATASRPRLTIEQDLINVRTGPGTNYSTGGSAAKGEAFDIIGKSEAGDWWLVCCVAGEPVWVFGQLGRAENAASVPFATPAALAAAPQPAVAQPVATQAPSAPAAPAATDTPAPAPPPADDPCAGIGGDGCKFKLKGGPAFAPNGGGELKLTLAFIHSGVEGGQPQGSYFVVLLKDGQNLNIPDSVRSFDPSVGMRDGPNGKYNYEYKVGSGSIPGGTVAGNYTIWVLDGNGERDSQSFNFTVPDGQGEVYILFDQA